MQKEHIEIKNKVLEYHDIINNLSSSVSLNKIELLNKIGKKDLQDLHKNLDNFIRYSDLILLEDKFKMYVSRDELHNLEIEVNQLTNIGDT